MDGFMGAGVHAFGAVGAKRSPPAAKRVGAKAARATPAFISSSESRRDSMRSRAIDVNARAAESHTSPTEGASVGGQLGLQ